MKSIMMTPYWYITKDDEGNKYITYCKDRDELLTAASRMLAFSDCCYDTLEEVHEYNMDWQYCGWQPMMVYEWVSSEGIAWAEQFERWDH
jgi:hypothetical protein